MLGNLQVSYGAQGDLMQAGLGLPFPTEGCLDASPPHSCCQVQGTVPIAGSWAGGGSLRTPEPPHCCHHLIQGTPDKG